MNLIAYLSYFVLHMATPNWQTYKTTPEVDVFYRAEQCHDAANGTHREYILLKFVNKTDKKVQVSWQLESYQDNVCTTCNKDEYKYSIDLAPNQTLEADCSSAARELKIFVKHLDLPNPKTFTKFELGNLATSVILSTHTNPRF